MLETVFPYAEVAVRYLEQRTMRSFLKSILTDFATASVVEYALIIIVVGIGISALAMILGVNVMGVIGVEG